MGYPFWFFGRSPTDWVEGANEGHRYTVRFVEAPSAAQRQQIAVLFERALARGPVELGRAKWTWSAEWASFVVGERWPAGAPFFSRMADVLRSIHAIAAMAHVHYANARGASDSDWDQWTRTQAAHPPVAPGDDAWSEDTAFEATRSSTRVELIKASVVVTDGEIALVPLPTDAPYPQRVRPATTVTFGVHDMVMQGESGRIVATTYSPPGNYLPLAYVDADQLKAIELPGIRTIRTFAISDDGTRVLIAFAPLGPGVDTLAEVTLATGALRELWSSPGEPIKQIAWRGDRVFVLTNKKLYWLQLGTGLANQLAMLAAGGMWLAVLRDGTILTTYQSTGNKLTVVGVSGDKLKALAKLTTPGGCTVVETPERIHVFVQAAGKVLSFELVNVDDAIASLAPKRKATK